MNYTPVYCDHDPRYEMRGEVMHVTCTRCEGWAAGIGLVPTLPRKAVPRG